MKIEIEAFLQDIQSKFKLKKTNFLKCLQHKSSIVSSSRRKKWFILKWKEKNLHFHFLHHSCLSFHLPSDLYCFQVRIQHICSHKRANAIWKLINCKQSNKITNCNQLFVVGQVDVKLNKESKKKIQGIFNRNGKKEKLCLVAWFLYL